MIKYYKDYGVAASITVHKDGTATLVWCVSGGERGKSNHKNEKSAYAKWRRMCS